MSEEKPKLPFESPVVPTLLKSGSRLKFRCHKGISCFNACCKNIDIQLTPYDILRLKGRLGMTTHEFLPKYTYPFEMDAQGLPGVKLRPVEGGTACQFMDEEQGCTVYEDRPTACRYYPLGLMSLRRQDEFTDQQAYALVEEEHCKGHEEDQEMTVDEYRRDQGVEDYDLYSRGWRQIILKKKSAGPAVGKPSELSMQLFFMASYHIDQFQNFITSEQFQDNYVLPEAELKSLANDQVAVIDFGVRLLKQVLFGEESIEERQGAADRRVERIKQKQDEMRELIRQQVKADIGDGGEKES